MSRVTADEINFLQHSCTNEKGKLFFFNLPLKSVKIKELRKQLRKAPKSAKLVNAKVQQYEVRENTLYLVFKKEK